MKVFPGNFKTTRTLGNAEYKVPEAGGNPLMIISEPDILAFEINHQHEFIVMGSNGVFDTVNNQFVANCVRKVIKSEKHLNDDIHKLSGLAAECVLKNALY